MADPAAQRRAAILGRVHAAKGYLPSAGFDPPPPFSFEQATLQEWRERFVQELEELGVVVHQEDSAESVRARVRELVSELAPAEASGDSRLLTWKTLPYGLDLERTRGEPGDALLGVTGVDAAVAETGSLMLISSTEHLRTASLLPPVHLAVVRTGDLVPNLGTFLRNNRELLERSSCLNVVTGPSRTADIELALTLGVHGPGRLIVVLGP